MARIKPAFKYYGGKFYLTPWIISNFPEHETYIEPFGGSGSVLLNKPRSKTEIYSDLNENIIALMILIRDDLKRLTKELCKIKVTENNYLFWKSKEPTDNVEKAIKAFVIHRMSRSGTATGFSKSKRFYRGMPENEAAWDTGIKNLPKVNQRLQNVSILNENAFKLITENNNDKTLLYLDPPYVTCTRTSTKVYQIEMDQSLHIQMAELVKQSKAKIVISGYNCDLYKELFRDWNLYTKDQYLHSSHKAKKSTRVECLWKNF